MPYCSNCGAEAQEGASFCIQCGTAVVGVNNNSEASSPVSAPTPAATQASAPACNPAPAAFGSPAGTTASVGAGEDTSVNYSAPTPVYAQGCVSAAWQDITNSEGWIGKLFLMALIYLVPILNWVLPGYCMRWSRQLVLGRVENMPKNIFCNRAFINGVFYFVIGLVISIITMFACAILGVIPIIGFLAAVALGLLSTMFLNLCLLRCAVADNLGAGFQWGKIWETLKRNPGSLFCAAVLPGLIISAILGIICTIVISIALVLTVGSSIFDLFDIISYYSDYSGGMYHGYYSYYGYEQLAGFLIRLLCVILPVVIVVAYICGIGSALADLLSLRAVGHWVARYAPDWATDPAVSATAHIYDALETQPVAATASPAPTSSAPVPPAAVPSAPVPPADAAPASPEVAAPPAQPTTPEPPAGV